MNSLEEVDRYVEQKPLGDVYFPPSPINRFIKRVFNGFINGMALFSRGDFGGSVLYNPSLFPNSHGAGKITFRHLDGTFTIREDNRPRDIRIPARLVYDPSSA